VHQRAIDLESDAEDVEPLWPDFRRYFEYPRDNEDLFYPSYTRLLYALFSPCSHYNVVRRFPSTATAASEESKRLGTTLVVEVRGQPVFFVDVEPPHLHGYTPTRMKLMKSKFKQLGNDAFVDILYGVSAHGAALYFYKYENDVMTMEPSKKGNYGSLLNGSGLAYMKWVVNDIKARVDTSLRH
jgi:hypothetical protein